jgi:Flp pilus assembly pilin Flp
MLERLTHWTMKSFSRFEELRSEEGQALVEYALILSLIAVVCIGVLTALGLGVQGQLQAIVDAL